MSLLRQDITSPILPLYQLVNRAGVAGWILLFNDVINAITVRQRDSSQYTALDGSALFQMAYVGFCVFYSVAYLMRYPRKQVAYLLVATPALLLLLYTGFCAFSSLWSPRVI